MSMLNFASKRYRYLKPWSSLLFQSGRPISHSTNYEKHDFKMLVVGGGSGGCSTAAKFSRTLGPNNVVIVEPTDIHYYQPMWTLVGGGIKSLEESGRPMRNVLPDGCKWIKDRVVEFDPGNNKVHTLAGKTITYDNMVLAAGLQLDYKSVKGLEEALQTEEVCSNYSSVYVKKTFPGIKNFKEGNAIFTFPNTPIKCPGAPQKIMYLAEDYFRKNSKRQKTNVMYFTSLPVIFPVKKYANELLKIVKQRDITINLGYNLIEVNHYNNEAIFENLNKPGETYKVKYDLLHVTPPMSPVDVLKKSVLSDPDGWVNVNKETLQHITYSNVFGIGDCTNLPTKKTAAAIAGQVGVLHRNLASFIQGKPLLAKYDGYTSCPIVTAYGRCILAEFGYDDEILETFPIDQGKESRIAYFMKKEILPEIYWNLMMRGYWNGPRLTRNFYAVDVGMSS